MQKASDWRAELLLKRKLSSTRTFSLTASTPRTQKDIKRIKLPFRVTKTSFAEISCCQKRFRGQINQSRPKSKLVQSKVSLICALDSTAIVSGQAYPISKRITYSQVSSVVVREWGNRNGHDINDDVLSSACLAFLKASFYQNTQQKRWRNWELGRYWIWTCGGQFVLSRILCSKSAINKTKKSTTSI